MANGSEPVEDKDDIFKPREFKGPYRPDDYYGEVLPTFAITRQEARDRESASESEMPEEDADK